MSLYDDIDTDKAQGAKGWSSGIKLIHNQLAFKKASITAPKREQIRRSTVLPPVIDLKSRREDEENVSPTDIFQSTGRAESRVGQISGDQDWNFRNEYNPMWPNDYEKVVKEMRDKKDREEEDKRMKEREERDKRRRDKREDRDSRYGDRRREDEEQMEGEAEMNARSGGAQQPRGGAAIAPPASLDRGPISEPTKFTGAGYGTGLGGSVAAKIMAKYGFKDGQGLGKSKQGIVRALEVEKTSKRGGRIVAEKDGGSPPPPGGILMPPAVGPPRTGSPPIGGVLGTSLFPSLAAGMAPPSPMEEKKDDKADIGMLLRNPSKVVLLRNMVGPGEVDDDLEPEVKDECHGKYGPVIKVVIFEIPKETDDESVRIFVEFQRVESAIKAVIDLNGRFFGGRQVKAGFYDFETFRAYKLHEATNP